MSVIVFEEKFKKIIRTFLKEHILGMAWQILLKFGIEGASPQQNVHNEICKEKIVQGVLSYKCVKRALNSFSLLL